MSHRALPPETQRVLKNHGVIAYTPSRMPAIFSFLLTGALFTAALLLTFGQVLAGDRDEGRYTYDQTPPCVQDVTGLGKIRGNLCDRS